MRILTREDVLQIATDIPLRRESERQGEPVALSCRRLSATEYWSFLPPLPPGSAGWGAADYEAWLGTLTPAQQEARRAQGRDFAYRLVAAASLAPRLTLEAARQLGEDAVEAADAILTFSKLVGSSPVSGDSAEVSGAPAPDAAAEPAGVAA